MTTRYVCGEQGRRRAVRNSPLLLNGIDFIEVSEDQLRLSVHFLKIPIPAGIDAENVLIEGGERITDINVVALAVVDDILNIDVSASGDYSLYTLQLVNITNLDPRLSSIQFSFKVNCPSDLDCRPVNSCTADPFQQPDIDYLARDYSSFKQLMLDRISVLIPDWRERNPADLGIALMEMFAYLGDHLSYYQDAVGTEAYLNTARQRTSVRRHARLVDYFMHEGANARAFVIFTVEQGSSVDGTILPGPRIAEHLGGTQLLTRSGPETVVTTRFLLEALNTGSRVFETLYDVSLHARHNEIRFYSWSDEQCCLPIGSTAATIRGPLSGLHEGELLLFEEIRGARTGVLADADLEHRQVIRLTRVQTSVDPLDDTPVVEIEWSQSDALTFPLCLSSIDDSGLPIDDVSVARGNVVLADHGFTRSDVLNLSGEVRYGLMLNDSSLTHAVPLPEDYAELPAAELNKTESQTALPQIQLFAGEQWQARRDLLGSNSLHRHFVVELDEDGRAQMRFGDNVYGMRPESDTEFTAIYRSGNGPDGNVGTEAIAHVVGGPAASGILSVRNPLPAWGGKTPESLEQVRSSAPHAFKVQERAVTEQDYARMAERHPEVQRAAATLRCTGSWYTVFLTIDRMGGLPVVEDDDFVASLLRHMGRFRMAGHDLEINGPRFVPLDITVRICVETEYFRGEIKSQLLLQLGSQKVHQGQPAFFHPDRWKLGESVYLSQLYASIMAVTGVASAEVIRFQRLGREAQQELKKGVLTVDRLEVVRLDNELNFQQNGRLQLLVEGGR